jgi:hypothetical protein
LSGTVDKRCAGSWLVVIGIVNVISALQVRHRLTA